MHQKIKWGILGTGRMAGIFTSELKNLPDAVVSAVGSRDKKKAQDFADRSRGFSHNTCTPLVAHIST